MFWMSFSLVFGLAGCDNFSDYASVTVSGDEAAGKPVAPVTRDGAAAKGAPAGNGADGHSSDPVVIGKDEKDNRGVRVGGGNGVVVGSHEEVKGVRVGGEYGVMAGSDGETNGVRVGGENGVIMGADDGGTRGVRVGGEKGVEVDVKKGISIGGKKIIGKKK